MPTLPKSQTNKSVLLSGYLSVAWSSGCVHDFHWEANCFNKPNRYLSHLEPYNASPPELGDRPTRSINRDDFDKLPEVEIERVIAERWRKIRGRRVQQFKVRWKGFGPEDDEWLTKRGLRNAPEVLGAWIDG